MEIIYPTFRFKNVYSPTNGVKVVEEGKFLKVKMTCGGGMGGCRWYEYIKETELKPNTIIEVETIFGEKKTINTKYVVSAEPLKYLLVKEDATPWRKHNHISCESYIVYRWYGIELYRDYSILKEGEYFDSDNVKDNLVGSAVYENGECVSFNGINNK